MTKPDYSEFIERTKKYISIMQETIDRLQAGEKLEDFFLLNDEPWPYRDNAPAWSWNGGNPYRIKPKIRPWTPVEAVAVLGKELLNGSDEIEQVVSIAANGINVQFHLGGSTVFLTFEQLIKYGYRQLDGSPCGEWEEVKK